MRKPPNLIEKPRKKIEKLLELDKKIVNKKAPNLVKVLKKKIDALCVRLKLKKVSLKNEIRVQRRKI